MQAIKAGDLSPSSYPENQRYSTDLSTVTEEVGVWRCVKRET